MAPEMVIALCSGVVALIGAVTTMIVQLRGIHRLVNSRMTQALTEIELLKKSVTPAQAIKAEKDSK